MWSVFISRSEFEEVRQWLPSWPAQQGHPFLTRPVLKFKLHFRKQDGRSRNVCNAAYEILPGRGQFTARLVGVTSRHLLIAMTAGREVESEPIAIRMTRARFASSGPASPVVLWLGSSLLPLERLRLSFSGPIPLLVQLRRGNSKRFAGTTSLLHQTISTPTPPDSLAGRESSCTMPPPKKQRTKCFTGCWTCRSRRVKCDE